MRRWAAKKIKAKIAAAGLPPAAAAPAAEGKRFRYMAEQLEFLRAGFKAMQVPELTAAFNARWCEIQHALTTSWSSVNNPQYPPGKE